MVNTAQRCPRSALTQSLIGTMTLAGVISSLAGASAMAQSSASFATTPYAPTYAPPSAHIVSSGPTLAHSAEVAGKPVTVPATTRYRGPPPIVMFRATPPAPAGAPAIEFVDPPQQVPLPPATRAYSIVNQAERDAANTAWNPASLEPVIAPPMVSGAPMREVDTSLGDTAVTNNRRYRGPMRRILEDTGRGIIHGIPEVVADALPWVDRDATSEPFNDVLARAADDLNRAAKGDPAWARPAQREIRALSRRLDTLAAPPQLAHEGHDTGQNSELATVDERPFRPRPIWPGATGRPEVQVRPMTLITASNQESGPRVTGVAARYVPAAEDDDGNPVPIAQPPRGRASARGTPVPKRKPVPR